MSLPSLEEPEPGTCCCGSHGKRRFSWHCESCGCFAAQPSLEVLAKPRECEYCGGEIRLIDPPYCAECDERLAAEKRRESANDFRRQAQIRLELVEVRQRVTRYLRGE